MKEGDYLICKKNWFFYNEGFRQKLMNILFKKPTFKSGRKYKLEEFRHGDQHPYVLKCQLWKADIPIRFDKKFISKHFYNKIEERKKKLEKLDLIERLS